MQYSTIDPRLLCKAQPTQISHNVTFVVDCSYLAKVKDQYLRVDDMDVWISKGSRKTCFTANISVGCVSIDLKGKGDNHFVMHRSWHTHGTSEDFCRLTVFIEGKHFSDSSAQCLNLAYTSWKLKIRPVIPKDNAKYIIITKRSRVQTS